MANQPDAASKNDLAKLIRFARRLQTDANGLLVVAFPEETFENGVTPIIEATVEAHVNTTNYLYQVHMVGVPKHSGFTLKVTRISLVSVNVLNLFSAPGAIWVHVIARIPTA